MSTLVLAQAKIYSDGGADEICFLDITASNENRNTIYEVVEKTSTKATISWANLGREEANGSM